MSHQLFGLSLDPAGIPGSSSSRASIPTPPASQMQDLVQSLQAPRPPLPTAPAGPPGSLSRNPRAQIGIGVSGTTVGQHQPNENPTVLVAELKAKINQLEAELAAARILAASAPAPLPQPPAPVPAPAAPPPLPPAPPAGVLYADPDVIDRARTAVAAVSAESKKVQLPPITPGFKANPLDIGEFIIIIIV